MFNEHCAGWNGAGMEATRTMIRVIRTRRAVVQGRSIGSREGEAGLGGGAWHKASRATAEEETGNVYQLQKRQNYPDSLLSLSLKFVDVMCTI